MTVDGKVPIKRKGFRSRNYPVPQPVIETAERLLALVAPDDVTAIRAELRRLTYIGEPHISGYWLDLWYKREVGPTEWASRRIADDGVILP